MNKQHDVVNQDLEYITNAAKDELAILAGKNLLVAGGAGFLGYYLIQTITHWNNKMMKNQSIRLTLYDNFIRGVPGWLTDFTGDDDLSLVKHDITKPMPQDTLDFDYIIHAASIASPTYYRIHPIETMDANVNGLRNLLEYCLHQKRAGQTVQGLLFFSSSEIYGNPSPQNIPTPETYHGNVSCTGPRSCYDESKRYGETLCVNFSRQFELPIKIARPFNNYGPGLKITDRRVIPDFSRDVLSEKDIVMHSDGSPTRTYCYVADAIVGYYKILVKGRKGQAYNIGVERPEISVNDLAYRIVRLAGELYGYTGNVIHEHSADKDYLIDNPQRRCPCINKARKELNYNPTISLEEGLTRSLIWYYNNRDAEEG